LTYRYSKAIVQLWTEKRSLAQTQSLQRILIYYMTHPIYTESALAKLSAAELKQIASELGAAPTGDERDFWLKCILVHQSGIACLGLCYGREARPARLRKVFSEVPTDLIEEKTLELLGVVIIDREDQGDFVVPHGEIRFWVHRCDELIGTISTWVIGGVDTYHPKDYSNPQKYSRYRSLWAAAISLVPQTEVNVTYRDAEFILRQRFATAPDYI
jgi:hypothetical protein